ncbi:MAG: hypothetical protein M1825_005681 [Sarcosagium campestre]|nr:MAG: hypothetical protein M1825_005681 [Sarcosagium campestre]
MSRSVPPAIRQVPRHPPLKATASANGGPQSIPLFLTNLHLLDLDLRPDWPGIDAKTFSTKDAQQNQRNRIRCVEWALFRLFELWDPQGANDKLAPFFPPIEHLRSLNLRAALFRSLTELKKDGVLGREAVLRKSMLDECKGDRFEDVLMVFSTAVLKKHAERLLPEGGKRTPASRIALSKNLSPADQVMLEPLLIAHKSRLAKRIKAKAECKVRYQSLSITLRDKQEQSAIRRKSLLNEGAHQSRSEEHELEDRFLLRLFRENWTADKRWTDLITKGESSLDHDPLLSWPFPEVWRAAERGDSDLLGKPKNPNIMTDLEIRVERQKKRLDAWRIYSEKLHESEQQEAKFKDYQRKARNAEQEPSRFSFHGHEDIILLPSCNAPGAEDKVKAGTSDKYSIQAALLPEYRSILESFIEDVKAAEKPQARNLHHFVERDRTRTKPDESQPSHGVSSTDEDPHQKKRHQKVKLSDNNGRENSKVRSRIAVSKFRVTSGSEPAVDATKTEAMNETSLPKETAEEDHERLDRMQGSREIPAVEDTKLDNDSTAKFLRDAQISHLGEGDQDLLAEQIVSSITDQDHSPIKDVDNAKGSPADPFTGYGTTSDNPLASPTFILSLADRTRQSMSHFRPSIPNKDTGVPAPRNPITERRGFLTPEKQETPEQSRASTPRDELFSQEADYNSVFKSRPKIKLSPTASPAHPLSFLDQDPMTAKDEEQFREEWKSSPLGRMMRD